MTVDQQMENIMARRLGSQNHHLAKLERREAMQRALDNALVRKYFPDCKDIGDVVQKQINHGYIPTIITEDAERSTLAEMYDEEAAFFKISKCYRKSSYEE